MTPSQHWQQGPKNSCLIISSGLSKNTLLILECYAIKGSLLFVVSTIALHVCWLGSHSWVGLQFGLQENYSLIWKVTIQYMPQWKTFEQCMTNVVAPSDFTWIFLTGFAKTWLQKFPSYTFTESCCGAVLFVIFYQIFTEYAAVERLSWVSYWILMSPPPPPKKNMVFIISHKTFCISVWNQCAYLTELIVVGCLRAFSCLEQSFPWRHH